MTEILAYLDCNIAIYPNLPVSCVVCLYTAIVDEVPPKTHVEAAPAVQVTNVVTTEVVPLGPRIHGDYPTTTSKALGCVQIIFGVVDVILALWRMFTLENRSTPYLIALTGITVRVPDKMTCQSGGQ